ncbi:MAG: chromosomal replication initiator protein DnaA [Actinobacteria bacterium]|nr:MAG: chromosomal replication initiator protein DnaA [Actinomycetota bacterium]TMM22654.1 MAG: chromosomal replication initiator protein DnaA [Actinomycetota bacterium]
MLALLFGRAKERPGGVEKPTELTAEGVWNEISGRLRETLNENTFSTWFAEVDAAEITDDEFVLSVPNDFTREWIEGHFLDLISAALAEVAGERSIRLRIAERAAKQSQAPNDEPKLAQPAPQFPPSINAKYTFDSFVIGSSNRFAHAAALAVAEAPAQAYNPLFIYGGTGLGKTHLLQAISQYVGEHPGNLSVRYVTSETFMNDFINSLRDKRIEGFKQRYRTYDLLLVDDVQFFEHKERIQEEFFHTFNSLYESGSQIVMSSDRPPRDIATLEERLRSRFEWGLITDIQPPDLETRIAILRKRVKTDNINVPDPQVLTVIAGRVTTNIRELEGALTRVVAFCSLTGRPMNEELAQDVLKDVFPQGDLPQVTIERIQEIISDRFGLSLDELCGDRRSQNIVYPRQVAMYLSRELTDSSLPKIGKQFGGRDHTTVIHATSKIARMIREDRSVYNLVQELTARIKQVR